MIRLIGKAAGGMLLVVAVLELLAGIFLRRDRNEAWGPPTYPHSVLGRIRPAGTRFTGSYAKDFRTNSLGFRGKPMSLRKEPGTCRVIILGGSVVEGMKYLEPQTIPGLVEKALNERFRGTPRVEVGNLSVPGISSAQSLAQIANRLLNVDPDVIVELDAGDFFRWLDPDYESSLAYEGAAKPDAQERPLPLRQRLVRWLWDPLESTCRHASLSIL